MGIFDFFKNKSKLTEETSINQNLTNKDEIKTHLDNIQKEIFQYLKPLGFKKKGRTFNRKSEEGIIQVINIQSGRYEFGDKNIIPGFRENLYGKFTVNLGVMIKEVYELESHNKPKDFYQEYNCQIRERLPILTINQDFWWPISNEVNKISKEVIDGLNSYGLDWLSRFKTREKIINCWGENANSNSPRAKLDVALIVLKQDKEKGLELIYEYYHNIVDRNPHKLYVKELVKKMGIILKD